MRKERSRPGNDNACLLPHLWHWRMQHGHDSDVTSRRHLARHCILVRRAVHCFCGVLTTPPSKWYSYSVLWCSVSCRSVQFCSIKLCFSNEFSLDFSSCSNEIGPASMIRNYTQAERLSSLKEYEVKSVLFHHLESALLVLWTTIFVDVFEVS